MMYSGEPDAPFFPMLYGMFRPSKPVVDYFRAYLFGDSGNGPCSQLCFRPVNFSLRRNGEMLLAFSIRTSPKKSQDAHTDRQAESLSFMRE